jgi:ABC-type lipoprotein release transport system permease subunit
MGKLTLAGRLVARNLQHRPGQAVLLLLAITAATAVLTLGLALHGVTSHPYAQTRAATNGPDAVAQIGGFATGPHQPDTSSRSGPPATARAPGAALTEARILDHAPGVTAHSALIPVVGAVIRAHGLTALVFAEARSQQPSAVDQPKTTAGSWVRPGGIVLERTFADALGVGVGDRLTMDGHWYTVAGVAVTAAEPPYPNLCYVGCQGGGFPPNAQQLNGSPGLVWVTQADAAPLFRALVGGQPSYLLNLKLEDPASAQTFARTYSVNNNPAATPPEIIPWQQLAAADGLLVQDEQQVLAPGALLAGLLAIASVAVLAGGRMTEQTRRTGLLKAVGGTPGLVALVLLAENLVLAVSAAIAGLIIGRLAAPAITSPGAGLVGTPGAPSLTLATAGIVIAVALAVALIATLVPAIRAARISTVSALASSARPPRRRPRLIALSSRLPTPLLLGLRMVARRPRRALLSAASIAITVTGVVAVLAFHRTVDLRLAGVSGRLPNPVVGRDEQMLQILTVVLIALAILNAVMTAWATVLDTRRAAALARALGSTPRQVTAGITAAQVIPALPGALAGVPLGIGLFAAANRAGTVTVPPVWWLVAAVLATMLAIAVLTSIPARAGARRPPGGLLQAETA